MLRVSNPSLVPWDEYIKHLKPIVIILLLLAVTGLGLVV